MTLIATLPALVCLLGLLTFLLAKPTTPDVKRVGEIMFFCGLLVTLYALVGTHTIRIG